MSQEVTPDTLRSMIESRQPMVVEYYHESRDPTVAHAVDKAASWMDHHQASFSVPIYTMDIQEHAQELDEMGVRILPQPSTVAVYSDTGVDMFSGQLDSSKALVQRIQAGSMSAGGENSSWDGAMDELRHNLFR